MSDHSLGLVAESQIYREGIKALLKGHFPTIMEAEYAGEAARWSVEPDLILVDAAESSDEYVHIALVNRFRRARIVYMLWRASPDQAIELIRRGADGVLGPDLVPETLILYLRLILAGQIAVPHFALSFEIAKRHRQVVGASESMFKDVTH